MGSRQRALLALNRLKGLRNREKLVCLEILEDPELIFSLTRRDLEQIIHRRLRNWQPNRKELLEGGARDEEYLHCGRGGVLFYWDREYPPQLREIYDPPFMLFYRGEFPAFDRPSIGIVGTRFPDGAARRGAYELALELSGEGIPVVSGLARGIDGEAHRGALDGRGVTMAVLGNGIDIIYPASHRKLGYDILESGGLLLSEFPPGTPPLRYNFPLRNRIISGLSRSVVVIQAPVKSGALITVDYALEQGREVFVHAAGLEGPQSEGTRKLAEEGAVVLDSAVRLFDDWQWNIPRQSGEPFCGSPGEELAWRLGQELAGNAIIHNGDFFRR